MNPLEFFWMFLKASLLSTGGSGNLPFLHSDLIGLGLAGEADFVTAIAVGQLSPGPSGLWSVALGYLTYGWLGALLALVALSLPPLLVVGVASLYTRIEKQGAAQNFMLGLSLGIIGLTLPVTYGLARAAILDLRGVLITLTALGLALSRKVPIVVILILAALAGLLLYSGA